ncbi:MAG TPA: DUF2062 domain-containing protein [Oscillospiraceae bacterium]|nr:DUF2062 domain-containing protein [Oscillospiraceae bacterium]
MTEETNLSSWEKIKKRFEETIEKQIKKDEPRKVALGCVLGLGINFFPTLGLGFAFAFLLAMLFRANRASATVTSLVTGPFIPLMYALNLLIGGIVLTPVAGHENLREFIIHQYAIILKRGDLQEKIFGFLEFFGSTFMVGAAINATVFGVACYFFVRHMLIKKAKRTAGK